MNSQDRPAQPSWPQRPFSRRGFLGGAAALSAGAMVGGRLAGVAHAEVVGVKSAPPSDEPTERDLACFFKLFSLSGAKDGVEQMCFFTFLQKTDDTFGEDW